MSNQHEHRPWRVLPKASEHAPLSVVDARGELVAVVDAAHQNARANAALIAAAPDLLQLARDISAVTMFLPEARAILNRVEGN